ncbi:MAG TPA: carbamoyltransferase C-terminal domain-containing protein [Dermatophilaceae bacterium]|nr:carbamoyltransferase C-terminal domain-containing protein [Dermatophilaceae bacterium]
MSGSVVLGLALGDDGAACLVVDGVPRVAIANERLTRRRAAGADVRGAGVPTEAVRYCLDALGMNASDVDLVVASVATADPVRQSDVRAGLPEFAETPVQLVGAHRAHAASVVALCGDAPARIIVADGGGSTGPDLRRELTSLFDWDGSRLERLATVTDHPRAGGNSLGGFYRLITRVLGFGPGEQGKTMGLAGYARSRPGWQPLPQLREAIRVGPGFTHEVAAPFRPDPPGHHPELTGWFGPPRPSLGGEHPLRDLDLQVAASAQWVLEEALLGLVAERGNPAPATLGLAGGVALNCVANARILREAGIERLVVPPAAGNDGCALGAALFGAWKLTGGRPPGPPQWVTPYLGRSYGCNEINAAVHAQTGARQVVSRPGDTVAALVADLLAGRVTAVFRGGSEFGPRALGHRSILADPRPAATKDLVNVDVKHRERFRPFAPMVPQERAAEFFELSVPSPYMLLTARVRRPDLLPAVTHVDGTARVQTVSVQQEPWLHRLLTDFGAATGVPVLLNTSFNDREPIVETPGDALRCVNTTGIEVLYLEDQRVARVRD